MRKIFTLIVCCLLCQCVIAQNGGRATSVPIYNNGPVECTTCKCNLDNLFRSWNKENIANHDEIKLIGYGIVDTLTDSLKIRHYFNMMTAPGNYFIRFSGNTRKITLLQAQSITDESGKKALQYVRDQLSASLTLFSTIYVIRMQLRDGTEIENYAICDKDKKQISYDNMFFYLWLFK